MSPWQSILHYFTRPRKIVYNGIPVRVSRRDIPGMSGRGRIEIENRPGEQSSSMSGPISGIELNQAGRRTYLNGVNLEDLMKKHSKPS